MNQQAATTSGRMEVLALMFWDQQAQMYDSRGPRERTWNLHWWNGSSLCDLAGIGRRMSWMTATATWLFTSRECKAACRQAVPGMLEGKLLKNVSL